MPQVYELNIRDYWNIFLKRRWIIALSSCIVLIATIIYTNLQAPLYKVVAVIRIEPIENFSKVFPQQYQWRPFELSDYARQVISLPIIKKSIRELGLISKDAPPEELDNLISTVVDNISAEEIEKTYMIKIQMVSQDPEKAAIIVNKIVDIFKLENIKQKNQRTRNVREFIEEQLKTVSVNLKESVDKLNALSQQGVGGYANALNQKIGELSSKREDLLTKFTELHPDVIKLNEQMHSLDEQLRRLPKAEFEFNNLQRDVGINEKLYFFLREKLQEAQIRESEKIDNVFLISPAVPPRDPFSPNKQVNYLTGILLGIIFGVSAGLVFEHLDTSIGRIEDLESITKINVIGVIPFYLVKSKEGAEALKRKSIFRQRSKKGEKIYKLRNQLIPLHAENSIFLEAFRILGANIQVIFGEGNKIKQKCILITSSNPQEGKSMIASNLAIIMAQMGYKIVLIDTDLRRSSIHNIFGLKKEKGVTDILTEEIALESALKTTTDLFLGNMSPDYLLKNPWIDNFNLITSGTTFPNSPYLLNTEKMNIFIKTLREKYDVIIMDSSPVLAVSDTSIITPKTDGLLLVYRAGATSRIALRRAQMQIESVSTDKSILKGIILNNVTPEASIDAYYYYHKKYYTEEEEETKAG